MIVEMALLYVKSPGWSLNHSECLGSQIKLASVSNLVNKTVGSLLTITNVVSTNFCIRVFSPGRGFTLVCPTACADANATLTGSPAVISALCTRLIANARFSKVWYG